MSERRLARTLMVQGTASSVGKSIVTAGLCRVFRQEGLRVAPFKAQNMALNAFVTSDGLEIGRAQAEQARAAGVEPTVDMNPILLKPEGGGRAQVVVMGKVRGGLDTLDYERQKDELRGIVTGALARLRAEYDLVVIEGAGSPAEINLKDRDLVNMFVAEAADAPVLLVGDIDRGGVFASLVGTLELLEPHERARVRAFVINKLRGDVALLEPGLRMLEARTGVPVLGVLPYLRDLGIADEDSVAIEERDGRRRAREDEVEIAVIRLPHLSNFDDFQPLEQTPGVVVRFVDDPATLEGADLVIVPGTKSTVADLTFVRSRGLDGALRRRVEGGRPILGICGGCQMLGHGIFDPYGVESSAPGTEGLGLLPVETHFEREKRTVRIEAVACESTFLAAAGDTIAAYEIHMGRISRIVGARAAFSVSDATKRVGGTGDGAISADGVLVGTMLHGLFESPAVRSHLVNGLRAKKGLPPLDRAEFGLTDAFDRLAEVLRSHFRMDLLRLLVAPA